MAQVIQISFISYIHVVKAEQTVTILSTFKRSHDQLMSDLMSALMKTAAQQSECRHLRSQLVEKD